MLDEAKTLRVLSYCLALFWTALTVFVLVANAPESPLALPRLAKMSVVALAPEGWGFFTRNPREQKAHIHLVDASGRLTAHSPADVRGLGLGGVSRRSRILGVEAEQLVKELPETAWTRCRGTPAACMRGLASIPVDNRMSSRSLCGDVLIQRSFPVPWAWARSSTPVHMPSQVVRLNVACKKGNAT